jgi:hypothetical protein
MRKRTRVILWIVIAILILAGFVWWQMWLLGRGLRTVHADNAQEVLLSAMSAEVLAPDVGGNGQQPNTPGPLLDQYRKDPDLIHQRYLLVMTWVHASQIYKTTDWSASNGKMFGSDALRNILSGGVGPGYGLGATAGVDFGLSKANTVWDLSGPSPKQRCYRSAHLLAFSIVLRL